ncbi:DUF7674 family protein [Chitinophaga solisilvae]|uniref:DUF7674 domain-containing protein n=1 Tax=Chitinophaga solisilvae TaxID=1233460 RepID=A0A3S1B441_9BACT|nr:hypothetical protein [Chitinophaga solisilvae]NSL89268.1 hypothetical protein [Chitinophaga solisilvae]
MLPDSKISQLIGQQIPALSFPMQQIAAKERITSVIHTFADYTGSMIRQNHLEEVKRCFTIAGVLYRNGSGVLRNAIESVFLFALSPVLCTRHSALLPLSLKSVRTQYLQTTAI